MQARDNAAGPAAGVDGVSSVFASDETGMEDGGPTNCTGGKSRGNGKRGGSNGAAHRATNRRDHWANQLCTPEWMLTVPNDLNGAGSTVGAGEPESCQYARRGQPKSARIVCAR